jgi:hypothetical protein
LQSTDLLEAFTFSWFADVSAGLLLFRRWDRDVVTQARRGAEAAMPLREMEEKAC